MTFQRSRFALLFGALALSFGVSACGDDDDIDDETPDTGEEMDAGGETDGGETDGGETDDGGGEIDGGTCEEGIAACTSSGDCGSDEACIAGCCEAQAPSVIPCSSQGQACDDPAASTEGYICDTSFGLCVARCVSENTEDTLGSNCPVNSYCFGYNGEGFPVNADGETLDGGCIPGDCSDSSMFDDDACEGVSSIFDEITCTGDTCHCLAFGNDASYCIAAGEGEADAMCESDSDCETGLRCWEGMCEEPCDLLGEGGAACGDDSCMDVFDTTFNNQPGICGELCTPYTEGECGDGFSCQPALGRFGINSWYCGAIVEDAPAEDGAACDQAAGVFAACGDGFACLMGEAAADAAACGADVDCGVGEACSQDGECSPTTCQPTCDPSDYTTCGGEGKVCSTSAIDGLGFCYDGCEPYPRGGEYGCIEDNQSCFPAAVSDQEVSEIYGLCMDDMGTAGPGEACESFGFIGRDCADLGVCFEDTDDEGNELGTGSCTALCQPFVDGAGCPTGEVCASVPPLLGSQEYSFCSDASEFAATAGAFESCEDADQFAGCAIDNALCIDRAGGTNPICTPICRIGESDCDQYGDDYTCVSNGLNPDAVPTWVGFCAQ